MRGVELEVGDGLSAEDVLLEDAFEVVRGAGMVPDALGVNDGDGALAADTEAVGFGALDAAGAGEAKFVEAFFQVVP